MEDLDTVKESRVVTGENCTVMDSFSTVEFSWIQIQQESVGMNRKLNGKLIHAQLYFVNMAFTCRHCHHIKTCHHFLVIPGDMLDVVKRRSRGAWTAQHGEQRIQASEAISPSCL